MLRGNYVLNLYYVTLGKCSSALEKEAIQTVKTANCESRIEIFGPRKILLLMSDYLEGVAPPVPSLDLEMETGQGVRVKGSLQRYDNRTDIDSWVFSMTGQAVAEIFEKTGIKLFARNVRGFLGHQRRRAHQI